MRDNPPTPNGEPPPGGGRVAPSRAARHAQRPRGEYPYPQQAPPRGYPPRPDGYGGDAPTQARSPAGAQQPAQRPARPAPDGYGYPSGGGTSNGYRRGRYTSATLPSGSIPPAGYQDPRRQRNGYAPNGYESNGYSRNGYGSNGYTANGYGSNGYTANGYTANGYGSNGYTANAYAPSDQAAGGQAPGVYAPNGYAPGGHPQRVVPSRAARHAPGRTRSGGHPPQRVAPSRAARYGRPPATGRQARHARRKQRSFWTELPVLIIAAFVLAIGVKGYVVQAFYIPSGSMLPTLQVNDRVLVNRLAYNSGKTPEHGDVVVFVREIPGAPPPDDGPFGAVQRAVAQGLGNAPPGSEDLIKRVMGRPGDVLEGRDGRLWRNGQPLDEPYLTPGTITEDFGPVTVAPGHLWVMGDNRTDSADSRAFGQVPMEDLVGRAVVLVWPFDHVGGL